MPDEVIKATPGLDADIPGLPLETCFQELEEIVEKLEDEATSLEAAIRLFERGMKLSRRCNGELSKMEKRIQLIVENAKGETIEKDFHQEYPE